MALSRIHAWVDDEILFADDLGEEFDNLYENALTAITPLTGTLDANNQTITRFLVDAYTTAGLPSVPTAGRIARVTDGIRGLWTSAGSQWGHLTGEVVDLKRDFGVTGDGVTDDRAAIQAALDSGALYVQGEPGKTYRVSSAGTKTLTRGDASNLVIPYALQIPPGVTFDLRGSTLKPMAGVPTDLRLVTNTNTQAATDTEIGLVQAVLDGDGLQVTPIEFMGITGLWLDRVTVRNAIGVGAHLRHIARLRADRLTAEDMQGQGWQLGSEIGVGPDRVIDSMIGRIYARNVDEGLGGASGLVGNPVLIVGRDMTIGAIYTDGCKSGVKLSTASRDIEIGLLMIKACRDLAGAFKSESGVSRVSLGAVIAHDCDGPGLQVPTGMTDVTIGSYLGVDNGVVGADVDVWLEGERVTVGRIESVRAGVDGVALRPNLDDFQIGTIVVIDPGPASPGVGGFGVNVPCLNTGRVGSIIVRDTRGTPNMQKGLAVNGTTAKIVVDHVEVSGATGTPVDLRSPDALVLNPRVATSARYGEITPTAATTTTAVTNAAMRSDAVGARRLEPIIELLPMNAAARALGTIGVTIYWTFGTGTMTLNHPSAAGTERFFYRIVGYTSNTVAYA